MWLIEQVNPIACKFLQGRIKGYATKSKKRTRKVSIHHTWFVQPSQRESKRTRGEDEYVMPSKSRKDANNGVESRGRKPCDRADTKMACSCDGNESDLGSSSDMVILRHEIRQVRVVVAD